MSAERNTARRQKQEKAQRAEGNDGIYGILVKTIPHGIQETDTSGRITFANAAHDRIYGYGPGELLGKFVFDLAYPASARKEVRDLLTILVAEQPVPTPYTGKIRTKEGAVRDIQVDWNYKCDSLGNVAGFISVITDITEKIRAEKRLRRSEMRFRAIADTSGDMIHLNDEEGRILYANPATEKLLGYAALEILHKPAAELIHPDDRPKIERDMGAILGGKKAPPVEQRLLKKDGTYLEVEGAGFAVDLGDEEKYIGAILRDISQRKEAERLLAEYRDRLEDKVAERTEELKAINRELRREIDERRRAEDSLVQETRVNKIMADLAGTLIKEESIEAISDLILRHARQLTGSAFGYVGYIDPETGHLVSPTLTKNGWEACRVTNKDIIFHDFKGLWGWVLRKGRPLLTNNPSGDPRWSGEIPEGHIPVKRFLSVPALFGDKLVGQIALANPDGDYSEKDLGLVQRLADLYALAVYRKRADEELLLYRELVDQSNDAVFVVDPETSRFLHVNEKACSNLGYQSHELLGMKVIDIGLNVQDLEAWEKHVTNVKQKGYAIFETAQKRKDAAVIPVEVNARFIRHGGKEYIVSVARDITERKQAEAALVEEKNKLEAVLAALGDGLTLQDTDFRVLYQNAAHKSMQGNHAGEYCYKAYQNRDAICPGCLLVGCFEDGQVRRRETSSTTRDGNTVYMEVSASPVKDAAGNIIAGIETVRDITERKKLEREVAKKQKIESVGVLAGGIAHDFNNLLTAILGNVSLAKTYVSPEDELFGILSASEKASFRAKDLTQQLLTFSRGGAPITKASSIGDLIKESAQFCLHGAKVGCDFTIPGNLWAAEIDAGQISQVIQNLVTNADHAMPEGGMVYISAENCVVAENDTLPVEKGRYVKISVKDRGVGIPEEYLNRVFDPYFTTKQTGSGLGLAICYSIVRSHHGGITVDSRVGGGTTFEIFLPASKTAVGAINGKGKVEQKTVSGQGSVLLMDDEEFVRDVAARMLSRFGYQVAQAADGGEALTLYKKAKQAGRPYDLVIMDLTIPGGMGGNEAIKKLLEFDPAAKAVVSSGYANDPIMADFRKFGFRAAVSKPYRMDELGETLSQIISQD